jgi:hypothetical protein
MMSKTLILYTLCASCSAFQLQPAQVPGRSVAIRTGAPAMQFFGKKKEADEPAAKPGMKKRRSSEFYDDEIDTVSRGPWTPNFAENGEVDLANVGGVYYLAFVPFLLFVLAFSTGGFSFGYSNGNF